MGAVLSGLIVMGWYCVRQGRTALGGIAVGIATSLKAFPGLLLVYFLLRHRRAMMSAVATIVVLNLLTMTVWGEKSYEEWIQMAQYVMTRYSQADLNYSLLGALNSLGKGLLLPFTIAGDRRHAVLDCLCQNEQRFPDYAVRFGVFAFRCSDAFAFSSCLVSLFRCPASASRGVGEGRDDPKREHVVSEPFARHSLNTSTSTASEPSTPCHHPKLQLATQLSSVPPSSTGCYWHSRLDRDISPNTSAAGESSSVGRAFGWWDAVRGSGR
jgi:hypothetical protein